MDLSYSAEYEQFRTEVQRFLREHWSEEDANSGPPPNPRAAMMGAVLRTDARATEFRIAAIEHGYLYRHIPRRYGGGEQPADPLKSVIVGEEFRKARAPAEVVGQGPSMLAPTLVEHGTEEQKQQFIRDTLLGKISWCQGYSEPGSGSDLASLRTRAELQGDFWVINGQKIWTSGAQFAHWMFMMARTDPDAPKHKGISYFLVDMKSPGITVRPLTNLANQNMFNEVFFEDVRVPARNLVGELNRGWYIGTTTLDFERSSIGSAVGIRLQLDGLVQYAKEHEKDGTSRTGYMTSLKTELADRYVEANVARLMSYRVVTMQAKGMVPNHEASMTKLFASELSQRIARTGMKVLGLYGQVFGDDAPMKGRYESSYMTSLSSTIAGGTSEIQRNIIATRGLGLPRD